MDRVLDLYSKLFDLCSGLVGLCSKLFDLFFFVTGGQVRVATGALRQAADQPCLC
ncbi:hypothetical protein PRUB_b0625 [Pseudoalteromonas rubra]|uniref:Uncharacterized protein n=1 Tax=Pseudoalteromonas rubra TaxID=43658 RepID=A0A8T0C268_9GAMM|nr:hypothetical protein PRUB_b0625 [Pseudoalteromonas rubra]